MNLRTGLLYVCALLTALWVLGVMGVLNLSDRDWSFETPRTAALASDRVSETLAYRSALAPGETQTSEADRQYQAERRANRFKRFLVVAALVYVPPLVLLIFGTLIAWIARHFRAA